MQTERWIICIVDSYRETLYLDVESGNRWTCDIGASSTFTSYIEAMEHVPRTLGDKVIVDIHPKDRYAD